MVGRKDPPAGCIGRPGGSALSEKQAGGGPGGTMPPMNFGHFDNAAREYVITDPQTPTKWINYIGTLAFGGYVDHTGGALLCKGDPAYNRITKYIPQLPASDFRGTTLYLRIHEDPGDGSRFRISSPFFVPTLDLPDRFECRVGLGYSRIVTEAYGIRTDVTIFVPADDCREVRDIRVTNLRESVVEVDAIPVVEYSHPNALKQFTNADWVPQTMQSRGRGDGDYTVMIQYPFMYRDVKINYLTSNRPASSFETDRRRFLGANEYGTWQRPLALLEDELSSRDAERGDNISALLHHLGPIQPEETVRLITQLGQEASLAAAADGIARYRDPAVIDAALTSMAEFWEHYLATFQVETPDRALDSIVNVHNPHQCFITRQWSRYLSTYQLGLGSRGIGVRDSSQDVLAVIPAIPDEAREFLATLLSFQRTDGSAFHQFNPLTGEGSEGDSVEMEDRPDYYSDDHLWSVLGVTSYLKETGDLAFLGREVPFAEKDGDGTPPATGTVLEHLHRAVAFTRTDVGAHGLPHLGFADWNDTVNLPTGSESLFTAHLYGRVLRELIELHRHLGDGLQAAALEEAYEEMRARVEEHAWDGDWYVRYFDQNGVPLGSCENTYGQISLNAQSWAVLSGFASPTRARRAMDAVAELLDTPYGIKVSTPGFDGYDPHFGGVTTFPPGAKENGGIFLHTNPWAMIAETLLGDGDRAYRYYTQINPAAKNDLAEIYEIEPYVYAQNILSDEHPQAGLGRNSWLSGTASWTYLAATQWILGVRPGYDGLRIEPCIPEDWDGFRASRRYRDALYTITVVRGAVPHPVLTVGGEPVVGTTVPIAPAGAAAEVRLTLPASR